VSSWQGVLKHNEKNQQIIRNTIVQAAVSIQHAVHSSTISINLHHFTKKVFITAAAAPACCTETATAL